MPSKNLYKLKMSRRADVIGNKSTHNKIMQSLGNYL